MNKSVDRSAAQTNRKVALVRTDCFQPPDLLRRRACRPALDPTPKRRNSLCRLPPAPLKAVDSWLANFLSS